MIGQLRTSDDHINNNSSYAASIIHYGVSEQLVADFEMLQDVQSVTSAKQYTHAFAHNNVKFYPKTIQKLRQHIVCRNYGNICYELSHLCWAILHAKKHVKQSLLDYFWVQNSNTVNGFSEYFKHVNIHNSNIANANMYLEDGFLQISIHQHDFAISANRANLLSCLMEWLIGFIPDFMPMLQEQLVGKGHNAISETASTIQKHIYQYLQQHLPTAKLQQRYRTYENWYQAQQLSVNDDSILAFWRSHKQTQGHAKYASVVSDSLAYLQALDMAATHQQLHFAHANEEAHESGIEAEIFEIYENNIDTQTHVLPDIDLYGLSKEPKIYNKLQIEMADIVCGYPLAFPKFCLSWLRSLSFGNLQNKLIQAKRQNSKVDINTILIDDFDSIKQQTATMLATGNQALMAIVQLLLKEHSLEAMQLLIKLVHRVPSLKSNRTHLSELLDDLCQLDYADVQTWRMNYPWFADLLKACERALKQINRNGFTPDSLLHLDAYLEAASQVLLVDKYLGKQLKQILKNNLHQNEKYHADRLIFIHELSLLYDQDEQ